MRDGIPAFSQPDLYSVNYEQIAADHLVAFHRNGTNPFIPEELWVQAEDSTRDLIRRYGKSGDKILDVGVGVGRLLSPLHDLQRYGMDISWAYLEIARTKGIDVCYARIEDMPYRDALFDLVVCTDVLEHVFDLNLCCLKILSVLKPGGALVARVPYKENLSGYTASTCPYRYVHLRAFDEHALRLLFERVLNCKVLETELAGYLPYDTQFTYPLPIPKREVIMRWVLGLVKVLRPRWHTRLLQSLYQAFEINIVVRKPVGIPVHD